VFREITMNRSFTIPSKVPKRAHPWTTTRVADLKTHLPALTTTTPSSAPAASLLASRWQPPSSYRHVTKKEKHIIRQHQVLFLDSSSKHKFSVDHDHPHEDDHHDRDSGIYTKNQRWVGRRVQPWDASFSILPWGLVPQNIVKSEVTPRARERLASFKNDRILTPGNILRAFGNSIEDVQLGAEAAYRFVANTFSEGRPCFEAEHQAQVKPQLAACFDLQLRQIPKSDCLVEIHDIHDVTVTTAVPLLTVDPTNPELLEKSRNLFRFFGMNGLTAQLHFLRTLYTRFIRQITTGENQGFALAVEVIIQTSETAHFGPSKGVRYADAEHALWFYSSDTEDIFNPREDLSFELANMNEALSMIHDTATPELWAVKQPSSTPE